MELFSAGKSRVSLTLLGEVTAITPISISRPDDNFKSVTADDKKPRLPRMGAKREDVSPFITGSSFRGGIRRCAVNLINRYLGEPFTVDQLYMLTQGVDTTKLTSAENVAGEIEKEESLRLSNPALSLFGRWGLPSHLGTGDLIPIDKNCFFTAGAGVRTNEFIRNPSAVKFINKEELGYLHSLLQSDSESSSDIRAIDAQIKLLIKDYKNSEIASQKAEINAQISELERQKKDVKANKVGSENTIQRPLPGYEAIIPGTLMNQRIALQMCNESELGLFLATLAEFARNPVIGGHANYANGAISIVYSVNYWAEDEDRPSTIATITINEEGFEITGTYSTELYRIRDQFKADVKNGKFDFKQFLISPLEE